MPKFEDAIKNPEIAEMIRKGQFMLGNDKFLIVEKIQFGLPALDNILGGGLPRRRVSILYGSYSAGKSVLAQIFMKKALEDGLSVAYVDTEQTFEPIWWAQVGLPIEKIIVMQPSTGEEAVDGMMALAKGGVDVIVLDSIAAMVPSQEAESKAEDKFIGSQPRLVASLMRKLLSARHNSVILCTNQISTTIGGPGPFDPMPGGDKQRFAASLLIRLQREGWITESPSSQKKVGFNIRVICRKNKVATPFGEVLLPFRFRGEIDLLSMVIDRALEHGIVTMKGPWYYVDLPEFKDAKDGKIKPVAGRNGMIELLQKEPKLAARLEKAMSA